MNDAFVLADGLLQVPIEHVDRDAVVLEVLMPLRSTVGSESSMPTHTSWMRARTIRSAQLNLGSARESGAHGSSVANNLASSKARCRFLRSRIVYSA